MTWPLRSTALQPILATLSKLANTINGDLANSSSSQRQLAMLQSTLESVHKEELAQVAKKHEALVHQLERHIDLLSINNENLLQRNTLLEKEKQCGEFNGKRPKGA